MEHRITQAGPLLDGLGRLKEPGYATSPVLAYERAAVGAPAWRITEWDSYLVNDDARAVALTFSDLGYVGLVSASVLDFERRAYTTQSEIVIAPLGRMKLPESSETGDIRWSNKRCSVEFAHVAGGRRLSFSMARFGDADLEAELLLDEEPRDSMVIATPWAEEATAFYYNRKIVGMRAQGAFRTGAELHEFAPETSLGLLDWGRGVWTYDNTWYWAVAQGYDADGRRIGLNLGYGFGDTSAASENMLFVDGVAHKLGRCDLGLTRSFGGEWRYMEPWHMSEQNGRVDLVFTPEIDRADLIDIAGAVRTEQHQVFGTLKGRVVLDDGHELAIDGLRCAAERVHNRY